MKRFLSIFFLLAVLSMTVLSVCSFTYNVTYTITYVNESGTEIAEKVTGKVNGASPDMAVVSPDIEGFALLDENDAIVSYSMLDIVYPPSHYERQATGTYMVVYTRVYTVNVHYIFQDTTTAAPSKSVSGKKGFSYSILSPSVTGYSPDKTYVSGNFNMNTKYYVIYYPENYSVSFDANGGTGAPSPVTKYYGKPLTLPSTCPSRTGYLFCGWSESKYGNVAYLPSDTYAKEGNRTLYAVWESDPGSGQGGSVSTKKTDPVVTTVITTTQPSQTPTDHPETEPSEKHYKVQYNPNGGTGGPGYQYKIHGKPLTLSNSRPTRSGYKFLGWSENRNASSPTYNSGGTYTKNSAATLYAVWQKSMTYSITYVCVLLTSEERTMDYPIGSSAEIIDIWTTPPDDASFMGWSTDQYGKEPEIYPGEELVLDSDITLYALFDYLPYDLVIFDLTLDPVECVQGTGVSGSFKIRCNNFRMVVSDINIAISAGGSVKKNISFTFLDSRTYLTTFTLDTSSLEGNVEIKVELDPERKANESDTRNNTVSSFIRVNTPTIDEPDNYSSSSPLSAILLTDNYVISSFVFSSGKDVKPSDSVRADFQVWTIEDSAKTVIYSSHKDNVVVPAGEENLVWFKWLVPEGQGGRQVFGTVTFTKGGTELTQSTTKLHITDKPDSTVPDTNYSTEKIEPGRNPGQENKYTSWSVWEFTTGKFVKKTYSLDFSSSELLVTPGEGVLYFTNDDGKYVIKSGYGISARLTLSYSSTCPSDMISHSDYCIMLYPEFDYKETMNSFDTMEKTGTNEFMLKQNPIAENSSRIHFTPLSFPDGEYTVRAQYLMWTPKGEFRVSLNSSSILIDLDAYKDWYYGTKKGN